MTHLPPPREPSARSARPSRAPSGARAWLLLAALVAALGAPALSCLPGDTRPPPATVLVTATASDLLLHGVPATATADGWSLSFTRFLIVLGRASLDGSACTSYSDASYSRILDMRVPGPQRVSVIYGLGQCDFGFRMGNVAADSVLGAGVTEDDRTLLRTPGPDLHGGMSGVSLHVEGHAVKGAVTKTFAWSFRQRVRYELCGTVVAGAPVPGLLLQGNQAIGADLAIHGEALFQDDLDPARARLRFDVFAEADDRYGNADGAVTLDELGKAPLPGGPGSMGPYLDADGGTGTWKTLEDYVVLGAAPAVPRFRDTGTCTITPGGGRGG